MDKIKSTKALAIALVFAVLFAIFPLTYAKASTGHMSGGGPAIIVEDLDNCLTDEEELEVIDALDEACLSAGCSIGIVITSDLGGKTSKQFADDYSDALFGAGSDAVVLLLFNSYDRPEYANETDWISTSGKMRNKLDKYIDPMFDSIYKGMGEPQGNRYAYNEGTHTYGGYDFMAGCEAFASSITLYAGSFSLDGEDVDPGFTGGGSSVTSTETKSFTSWLIELFESILRMLGGQRFGY